VSTPIRTKATMISHRFYNINQLELLVELAEQVRDECQDDYLGHCYENSIDPEDVDNNEHIWLRACEALQ